MTSLLTSRIKEAFDEAAKRGISVAAIAASCNISQSAVYQWRDGSSKTISGENLVELAELSGLNARWIINGKGPKYGLSKDEQDLLHGFSLFGDEQRHSWLLIARDAIAREAASQKLAS